MRARTKRKIKRILKSSLRFHILTLIIFLSLLFVIMDGRDGSQNEADKNESVPTLVDFNTGEKLFVRVCMKCHTPPDKYKSFTLYFGESESTWEVGIRKMILAGNVKLSADQVKLVAKYLEETYKGG
ncbi:MAG: LMBR1 domain-containing protein [Archaeoglobaceae archaeon]|nr:LMBR1 domain-containing protein [Archaeoglobaceae archaeon]